VLLGFLGGLLIAVIVIKVGQSSLSSRRAVPSRNEPVATDVINISRIRVAGIGGLGFVAMALVVAVSVPRIGQSVGLGMVLGALLAASLVAWRRRHGPLPSTDRHTSVAGRDSQT
jgi:hypothetical protein